MNLGRIPLILGVALLGALAIAPPAAHADKNKNVTVMSRNLYLGSDIITLATASSRDDFEQRASQLWRTTQQTDFPSRAALIADEIEAAKPDLIGLQEVALWQRGPDGVKDGSQTPATQVVYDWLDLLRDELRERGLRYRVVAVQKELDVEAPIADGYDIRFTQQDAVLARRSKRIDVSRDRSANFDSALTVPTQIGDIRVDRGWVGANVKIGKGHRFRFVNTHLEAYSDPVRRGQVEELTESGGPARFSRGPTLLVGDLNSDLADENGDGPVSQLVDFGFRDPLRSIQATSRDTCCQAENLLNQDSELSSRIDYILTRPRLRVRRARLTGVDPNVRTSSGLWPSDHAGVVATLKIPHLR